MLMKTLAFAATTVFLSATTMAMAQPQAAPAPMIRAELAREVSDHVWIIPDQSTPLVPNVGIIVGERAALVVDTGLGAKNGEAIYRQAQKLAPGRALYLISTHVHPEHDLGAGGFPATTKMIRSKDQEAEIAADGLQLAQLFASRSAANAELLAGATFRKADLVFEGEHSLDLGGVTVRILAVGPNHTRGDTVVFVEPDRVLFSGDVAMKAQPAVMGAGSSVGHWLEALDRLEALNPEVIVPSHGPIGDRAFIENYRGYLTAIQDRVRQLKREGRSAEEAIELIKAEMSDVYPDAGRLAGAARTAYAEAP